jgi:hypothetical protein
MPYQVKLSMMMVDRVIRPSVVSLLPAEPLPAELLPSESLECRSGGVAMYPRVTVNDSVVLSDRARSGHAACSRVRRTTA